MRPSTRMPKKKSMQTTQATADSPLAGLRRPPPLAPGSRRGLCVYSQRRPGPWKKHMSPSPDTALLAAEAAHPVRCAAMRTCAASHGHGVGRYGNSGLGTGTGTA